MKETNNFNPDPCLYFCFPCLLCMTIIEKSIQSCFYISCCCCLVDNKVDNFQQPNNLDVNDTDTNITEEMTDISNI